jgi:hypothetical protein
MAIVAGRMRVQAVYQPKFEDWLLYVVLPLAAHVILVLSALVAPSHTREALFGVGGATLLLLFIGIHNAWDSITYHVFANRGEVEKKRRRDEASKKDTP